MLFVIDFPETYFFGLVLFGFTLSFYENKAAVAINMQSQTHYITGVLQCFKCSEKIIFLLCRYSFFIYFIYLFFVEIGLK